MNLGALMRTAHAFDASFVFTIGTNFDRRHVKHADTSDTVANLPFHEYPDVASLHLPRGCQLVGIEI
ncbi:MAG: TrmH family RNA methyltransferase, partial [Pseudomonadota bacterium]